MRILPIFMLSTVISVSGCAVLSQQAKPSYQVIAASSHTQPRWLTDKTSGEAGYMFFVGQAEGASDLSRGEEQAEAHVKVVIRRAIQEQLRKELDAELGKMTPSQREALDGALAKGLSNLALEGVTPVERYWERLAVPVSDGAAYVYRLALLVRVSKERFEYSRAQAYRTIVSQVGMESRLPQAH